MLKYIKTIRHSFKEKISFAVAYKNDCQDYARWQYNNPKVKSQNAIEAKILRQAHVIEKGMSLSHPREMFGTQKASELLEYISDFCEQGFSIENSEPVKNALGVIDAYLQFHRERGVVPADIVKRFEYFRDYVPDTDKSYGIKSITIEELQKRIHGEFPEFFSSRHSVRQFADKELSREDIQRAVALAMQAPSACNRQSVKIYFYEDKEINIALGDLIAGNTGFDKEVPCYLVLTSDMSAFYDVFERNQVYVDGGIFAMALVEALHYYGIASCILQNGEYKEKNLRFKDICRNIPENEKIILFIAIGYYKDNFTFAVSNRKNIEDVLVIR